MNEEFVKKTIEIIRKTREISLPLYGIANVSGQKSEFAVDVVTQADIDTENFLKKEFEKLDPNIGFVGEETGGDKNQKKFWMVDPIDATGQFIRGNPFTTTMVALIEDGQVIFSVIYDFVNDVIYHAEKGKGAYKNGKRIHVNDRPITNSYFGWETHLEKSENLAIYLKLKNVTTLFKTVSAGYEFALIAEGRLEGRVTFDACGRDYDFAPGSLLVSEAGGIVKNIGSDKYDYKNLNFIATSPSIYEFLTAGDDAIFPIKK